MKKDLAYEYIKKQILSGKFPAKSALNIKEITACLNISRTPVNKALRQLEDEGYLEIIPQVGVFVKQQNYQEIYEKMLLCAQIDALLTAHAAANIREDDLRKLEEVLWRMEDPEISPDRYAELNVHFHSIIIAASGLTYIISFAKKLWDYLTYISNRYELFTGTSRKQSMVEHWMIYFALKERNSQLAKAIMEKHMERPIHSLQKRFGMEEKHNDGRKNHDANLDHSRRIGPESTFIDPCIEGTGSRDGRARKNA